MINMHPSLYEMVKLKSDILNKGCSFDEKIVFPENMHEKNIHLYSHSTEKTKHSIPDDIILKGNPSLIVRIRLNTKSNFIIYRNGNEFFIKNNENEEQFSIDFLKKPPSINIEINKNKMSDICSYLGTDLLGVTPSNYCFYFNGGRECRFCEIWQTFKNDTTFRKSFKNLELISHSIKTSLENDPHINHLAITSGNIKSYDFTANFYAEIGRSLKNLNSFNKLGDVLATLMPPDDFSIINLIKESGFNKIYFPIEVYDKSLFSVVCPGKLEYGYDKIVKALKYAVKIFGKGNVYTNFVYGIQSLNQSLDPDSFDPSKENEVSKKAIDFMIELKVIPAFTVYHYAGYNKIGKIKINSEYLFEFFVDWGKKVFNSDLVKKEKDSVIFSQMTLSNTLYNDCFLLEKLKEKK